MGRYECQNFEEKTSSVKEQNEKTDSSTETDWKTEDPWNATEALKGVSDYLIGVHNCSLYIITAGGLKILSRRNKTQPESYRRF